MDAVIKLKPEELTESFFEQLKKLAATAKRVEIRLDGVDAVNNLTETEIEERLAKLADSRTISFTMEELKAHIQKIAD